MHNDNHKSNTRKRGLFTEKQLKIQSVQRLVKMLETDAPQALVDSELRQLN